jgi:hypothetical protein
MYNNYFIANQIYYSRSKYTSNYTREVMSDTTGRMWEMRYYMYIYIFNEFNYKNNLKENREKL